MRVPLALVAGVTAATAAWLAATAGAKVGPNTEAAYKALNGARNAVLRGNAECRYSIVDPAASPAPPSAELLSLIGVLRRPATADDEIDTLSMGFGGAINGDYARRARVLPNRSEVFIAPVDPARPRLRARPSACFVRERVALDHRLRGKPAAARRLARRLLQQAQAVERKQAGTTDEPGLAMLVRLRGGFGGSGTTGSVSALAERGIFIAFSRPAHPGRLVGVVPDGVASIDFTFVQWKRRGARYVRDGASHRTAPVLHNIVALSALPGDRGGPFFPVRQVWRDAKGAVIKTIGSHGGIW